MNFSDAFKQTSQLCRFSPDGMYLVSCSFTSCELVVAVTGVGVSTGNAKLCRRGRQGGRRQHSCLYGVYGGQENKSS